VSITVDPENDTPERLRDYAQRYRARPGTWSFLTGSPDYVRRTVVDGFKQVMEPAPGGETSAMSVLHGTRFMLFDRRARLRGLYETDAERLSDLARDATTLTSESER